MKNLSLEDIVILTCVLLFVIILIVGIFLQSQLCVLISFIPMLILLGIVSFNI